MRILYYDCFSGISGDMNLGALLDIGIEEQYLKTELEKLHVSGYTLKVGKAQKMGIEGTQVTVELEHSHNHEHHSHGHHHHEPHRNLYDINKIIDESSLNQAVKDCSKQMFLLIGKAEAKIHGKSLDEIHFHEVGAIDSIVDIVGAAICLDKLGVDKIMSSSVEVGGGFVKCAHGTFPVPAPATAEILMEVPVKKGAAEKETTTPTGAAILAANVNEFSDQTRFTVTKTGYGIGHKDLPIPNVLRVFLAETKDEPAGNESIITECNIDDMNPELYDIVMESLFENGADDVYFTNIQMKKNRPAVKISVLHRESIIREIEDTLIKNTSTFGLRRFKVEKTELHREVEEIDFQGTKIRVKLGYHNNQLIKAKAEYEDCKTASKKLKINMNEVYMKVEAEINTILLNRML